MFKSYSMDLAGRTLTIETGKMAGLANASVLVKYGETTVLVNVTASKEPKEGIDFFPLSVEYNERQYAVGKIPGSFQKREGKPSEKAILTSRAIDRPIRPLFPKDFRNDVVVDCLVLSVDQDCSPEICAMIGSSAALSISDIPFGGPTGSVSVGYVDGEVVINPNAEQRAKSLLNLTLAGTMEKIAMIEAGAYEIKNDVYHEQEIGMNMARTYLDENMILEKSEGKWYYTIKFSGTDYMNNHRICLNGKEVDAEVVSEDKSKHTIELKFETDSVTPNLSTKIYVDAMERDVEFDVIPKEDTLNLVEAIEEPVEKVEAESTSQENEKTSEETKNEEVKENSTKEKTSNKTIFIGIGAVIVIAIIVLVLKKSKK